MNFLERGIGVCKPYQGINWSPCLQRKFSTHTCPVPSRLAGDRVAVRRNVAPQPVPRVSSFSGRVEFSGNCGTLRFSDEEEESSEAPTLPLENRWKSWMAESRRLRLQLNSYGVSGLLAYGLLNTLYYVAGFVIVWVYFAKVPRGLGWSEVTKQFVTVMGLTWAASQITKVPRAALALLFAPIADGILIFVQARCRLRTRRNAFFFLLAVCLLIAALVFGVVVALWA